MYLSTSNRTPKFYIRLVVGSLFFLAAAVHAQDWEKVSYNSNEVDFNNACVVDDTTYALFGDQGTIALLNSNDLTTKVIRGDRTLMDLSCGTMLTNDTILVFDSSGAGWVTNLVGAPFAAFGLQISSKVTNCHHTRSACLVIATDDGLVVRTSDFVLHKWPEIIGNAIYEDSDGAIFVGTVHGDLLRYRAETSQWDTVCQAGAEILHITGSSTKVWFVTEQKLYSSHRSEGLQTWDASVFPETYHRDIACIDDTLVMSTTYGPILRQQLSVDGETWTGGEVGYKGYVPHGMLVGPSGILFYGDRGFYRHAKKGAVYDSAHYARYGLGIGRRPGTTYSFRSLCRLSESNWFATSTSPNAVLQSNDSGRTWQPIVGSESESTEYPQVATNGQTLYYLADSVRSIKVGQTWRTVKQWVLNKQSVGGMWTSVSADSIYQEAKGMVVVPSGSVFLYGGEGVYRVSHDLSTVDTLDVVSPRQITYMSRNSSGVLASIGNTLGISTDGGDTWNNYSVPAAETTGKLLHLYDDGTVLVVSVIRSANMYWRLASFVAKPPYTEWKEATVVSERNQRLIPTNVAHLDGFGTFVVSQSGYVAFSEDRGNTWVSEQPVPSHLYNLQALDLREPRIVRVAGDASVVLEKHFLLSGVSELPLDRAVAECTATWQAGVINLPMPLFEYHTAEVYNNAGQLVVALTTHQQSGTASIPIGQPLSPGVYIVVLRSAESISSCRMMVP